MPRKPPPPDPSTLIARIEQSSRTYYLSDPRGVYRVEDEAIDWFFLKRGKFQRLPMTKDGLYKSKTFPGFWLDPQALIDGDLEKVIEVVQQGIASPEHKRFVEKLRARMK